MAYSLSINKKRLFYLGYIVAFATLLSLFLLSKATEGSKKFEQLYVFLLITIVIGIVCLFVIVGIYLYQLIYNYRQKVPGASLSFTILQRTLLLAFIPLLAISFFAFRFLSYEFQSSFDQGINEALNNALVLSKKSLDNRAIQALNESRSVSRIIAPIEYSRLQVQLDKIRQRIYASELTVFDEKGFIQAYASDDESLIVPHIPEHSDFIRVESEKGLFAIEHRQSQFQIRTLTTIHKPGAPNYYLQSVFHIPDTVTALTEQVNKTISERDRLNYLMPRVNSSFIFVLILVLLLAGLLLILSSIGFANTMVKPIKDLISGTKKVSQGDFSSRVLTKRRDDFGTLVNAFNQMTDSLKFATQEAESNKNKVESERAYLATVINYMTAAVITLDHQCRLLTYNEQAEKLLDCDLVNAVDLSVDALDLSCDHYKNFIHQLTVNQLNDKTLEKEVEIEQQGITRQLVTRITPLPFTDELHGGYVIIFDDLSQYLAQQKQAAWEEVARRLAHEIKNPLTPILLAAERLNYRLSDYLGDEEKKILARSTNVITNQVKSLKHMVDDFSNYAKPMTVKKNQISFNDLLKDIFDLYKGHYKGIAFELLISANNDMIKGNTNLLRQVLHNLIKNAIEACEKEKNASITISSENQINGHTERLVIKVSDNGIGLPKTGDKVFEPYVTTKEKGTGLGLAIVKKIIQEHQGNIRLDNQLTKTGTVATLVLPTLTSVNQEKNNESTAI